MSGNDRLIFGSLILMTVSVLVMIFSLHPAYDSEPDPVVTVTVEAGEG